MGEVLVPIAGGWAGLKAVKGSFFGDGLAEKTINVPEITTARYFMLHYNVNGVSEAGTISITFSFNNNYGYITINSNSYINAKELSTSLNAGCRPTFSNGVLVVKAWGEYSPFASGILYEWALIGD